jgi:hypothetical protein
MGLAVDIVGSTDVARIATFVDSNSAQQDYELRVGNRACGEAWEC